MLLISHSIQGQARQAQNLEHQFWHPPPLLTRSRENRQQLQFLGTSVDQNCTIKEVTLNAAALSSQTSLIVQLSTSLHIPLPVTLLFLALVDSSSSHCFIDQKFADDNKIPYTTISPVTLCLLNGSLLGNITDGILTYSISFWQYSSC